MKCKAVHKDLIFYLGNELPDERMESIAKHLQECAACSNFLADLKLTMNVIELEKKTEVSPFFFTRLSARLDENKQIPMKNTWTRVVQPAFFSLLLIVAIYGGMRIGSSASVHVAQKPAFQTLPDVNDFEAEPIESFLLEKL